LKHKDYDFKEGRTLSRKAVFEALDLPLGVMAETSTEAHAIVSERRWMEAIHLWHIRTERKLNVDALGFWPELSKWQAEFDDVRRGAVDWRREAPRRIVDGNILTVDEMRMREYKLPPMKDGEEPASGKQSSNEGSTGNGAENS